MGDSGDIIAVLGELDRTIERLDPGRGGQARAAAATLVPPFGEPGAAGWYDRLLEVAGGRPDANDLDEAVAALALPPASRTVLAHRVIAVGAVARALPDRFGPGGHQEQLALEALSAPGILRSAPDVGEADEGDDRPPVRDEAPAFLALLADRAAFPTVGSYRQFLALAAAGGLVHHDLIGVPPPCGTDVVNVSAGGPAGVAVALVTQVCVIGVTLADLGGDGAFMNPANWSSYSHWCHMQPDPANPADPTAAARYLEVVALDCERRWFEVAVWLDVSPLTRRSDALIRTYMMSAEQATSVGDLHANGAVDVDEGTIKVVDEGSHLRVTSTKRVRFTAPIDPHALAVMACGAGYGALAGQFVVEGTGGAAHDVTCAQAQPAAAAAAAQAGQAGQAGQADDPFEQRLTAVTQVADECATAFTSAVGKAAAGTYTADDLVRDMSGSFARSVRGWAALVDLASAIGQRPKQHEAIRSDPVRLDPPLAGPGDIRLAGDMQSAHQRVLPSEHVRVEPPPLLPAGSAAFVLAVDPAAELCGTTYFGVAEVTDTATGAVRHVDVDIQIP